jgi:[ribosomal protein S18]-alanine N-acetyltransferase
MSADMSEPLPGGAASSPDTISSPDIARYQFRPMRLADARTAGSWRYPPDYAMYDLDPVVLVMTALLRAPLRWLGFYALSVGLPDDPMISVFSLIQRGQDVELGVGMRPDLMGHGLGLGMMLAGMDYARALLHPTTFSLTVATFNSRAITVYERADFQPGLITRIRMHGGAYDSMRMSRPA